MRIVPPSRPGESKLQVMQRIVGFSFPEKLYLVGVRGYYLDTMGKEGVNDIGMYDDAIFIVGPDDFYSYNANTDPSRQFPGVATLCPGLHYYRKGNHGISKPDGGYPALRPATVGEKLPVMRDGKVSYGIAINIHRGGWNTTSSLGCQTIYPEQWPEFQPLVYRLMDKYMQARIPYILVVNTPVTNS